MFRQDIVVQKATIDHVEGISRVCSEGWGDTYRELYPIEYIERVIKEFYNMEKIEDVRGCLVNYSPL